MNYNLALHDAEVSADYCLLRSRFGGVCAPDPFHAVHGRTRVSPADPAGSRNLSGAGSAAAGASS